MGGDDGLTVTVPGTVDVANRYLDTHFLLVGLVDQIEAALNTARQTKGQPTAIVMKTVKGKDVSFMENQAGWHGKAPNDAEYEQAMSELKAILAELEGK